MARLTAFGCLAFIAMLLSGFAAFAWMLEQDRSPAPRRTEGVVVLTGGAQRIGEGLSLLQKGLGKRLLISGVNERTGHDEMLKLHPSFRQHMACCVDLGAQARNTIGNAIETRKWLKANGFASLTVVTSRYHMPRALLELRHAMPGIEIVPHLVMSDAPEQPRWWRDIGQLRVTGLEYMKYLAASLRTRLEDDPETSRLAVIFGGRKPISPKIVSGSFSETAH